MSPEDPDETIAAARAQVEQTREELGEREGENPEVTSTKQEGCALS